MTMEEAAKPVEPRHVVMVADVVGSTALYEKLGDTEARHFVTAVMDAMKRVITGSGGQVTAEFGDGLAAEFPEPQLAAQASCALHETVTAGFLIPGSDQPQCLHIGMHLAGPGEPPGDSLGEGIRRARWAAQHAKPDQTLVTEAVFDRLPPMFKAISRYIDDETWDPDSDTRVTLFEVIWDVAAATVAGLSHLPRKPRGVRRITLEYGDQVLRLDPQRPVAAIGRGKGNDLVLPHDLVSRRHFTVQLGEGLCSLTDCSTNGTLLCKRDGEPRVLRRETALLETEGEIRLGHQTDGSPAVTLFWRCD